jgi:serine kinase of HPr protein (carbohydrate metabolism regulator)
VAVASLADTACVLFAEGVVPDAEVVETATQKGVNLLVSDRSAYELAVWLHERV